MWCVLQVLKGGSRYHAAGSMWYFPNALAINTHEKAFLFSDGYERSATVGAQNTYLWRHFVLQTIILPRQARDKHGENSKKRCVFAGFRCVADSSVPIMQPCAECEGKPCVCVDGEGTPPEATGIVDLSGALNWVSSAVAKSVAVARKATPATSSAMTLSFVNATQSSSKSYCCSPLAIKWTDGAAPHASSIASANGVDIDRVGAGFSLTVAATNRLRKLTIYAGCWAAKCTLHAVMAPTAVAATDEVGGTPQPVVRQVTAGKAVLMYRWEIFVRSSEDAAATLSVTWLMEDGDGNVTFQAAMLEGVLA